MKKTRSSMEYCLIIKCGINSSFDKVATCNNQCSTVRGFRFGDGRVCLATAVSDLVLLQEPEPAGGRRIAWGGPSRVAGGGSASDLI